MTNDSPSANGSPATEARQPTDGPDRLHLDVARITGRGKNRSVLLRGTFSIFVKTGSQLAIWQDFPQAILVVARNVATGEKFETMDLSMSGASDPGLIDKYAAMPANRMVEETFRI